MNPGSHAAAPKTHPNLHASISLTEEVAAALAQGRPVVALESTIVAHGMPYPQNVETAVEVEQIIRDHGAVPATIAVLDGKIRVGLDNDELERLATARDALKVSPRDLAHALHSGRVGATTVAGTLHCAALAGIRVFVTGGIGGVHRGGERSFDVSADLQALACTPVAVVCAGAKSILDIPLTLEYLETHGVPVVSVGQDNFAAFYCQDSGHAAQLRIDEPHALAQLVASHWSLGCRSGVVVSNPVPVQAALPEADVEAWIEQANELAQLQGISGKALTPFLLDHIKRLSAGRSLISNMALIQHNARLGAELAVALAAQELR